VLSVPLSSSSVPTWITTMPPVLFVDSYVAGAIPELVSSRTTRYYYS